MTRSIPRAASPDEVAAAYRLAYAEGCKGITIYRDGSRAGQTTARYFLQRRHGAPPARAQRSAVGRQPQQKERQRQQPHAERGQGAGQAHALDEEHVQAFAVARSSDGATWEDWTAHATRLTGLVPVGAHLLPGALIATRGGSVLVVGEFGTITDATDRFGFGGNPGLEPEYA